MLRHSRDAEAQATTDHQWFATTHWSVLLLTAQLDTPQASEALEKLCRNYWPPAYSYVRRRGFGPEEAQDLTQTFFGKLLEKNFWARADPRKGRFRSFLLTALRQFLADERDRARTAKRGGGVAILSFETDSGEEYFLAALDQNVSPEQQFDRQWATAVLASAREKLRQECAASGKSALYDRVNLLNDGTTRAVTYADVARDLGMSVSAVKTAVSRLRARYGELVRAEVAHTVSQPADVDGEIRYLLSVVGS